MLQITIICKAGYGAKWWSSSRHQLTHFTPMLLLSPPNINFFTLGTNCFIKFPGNHTHALELIQKSGNSVV